MNNYANKKLPRSHGFSLIEALVAFMIISVGMLGIASLQTNSMKAGHTAITRTSAVFNVEDILDRMRSNKTAILSYDVGVAGMGADNNCSDMVGSYSAPNDVTSAASVCTPDELAADDIYQWKRSLAPNVTAEVTVEAPDTANGRVLSTVIITIYWTERAVADTKLETENNFSVTVEM